VASGSHHVTTHLTPTSAFIPSPGPGLSHPFAKRNFSESSLIGMYLVPTPPLPILCIFYIPNWWFFLPPPSLCPVSRPLARLPQTPHRRVYLILKKSLVVQSRCLSMIEPIFIMLHIFAMARGSFTC
jgi:hypothetical protein